MIDYDRNGRIVDVLLNIEYHKKAYGVSCYIIKWKKKYNICSLKWDK